MMNGILNNSSLIWVLIFVLFLFLFIIVALILKNNEFKKQLNNLNKYIKEQEDKINNINDNNKLSKEEIIKKKEEQIIVEETEELRKEKIENKNNEMLGIKQEEVLEEKNNLYNNKEFKPSTVIPSQIDIKKENIKTFKIKEESNSVNNNFDYMKEVSKKIEEANVPSTIELTDYEKKQEEEAIISYKELVENKDKLYNITDDEEDFDFINELKSFRNEL